MRLTTLTIVLVLGGMPILKGHGEISWEGSAIKQSSAIVEGHFEMERAAKIAEQSDAERPGRKFATYKVPFLIDTTLKGDAKGTISVILSFSMYWPNAMLDAIPFDNRVLVFLGTSEKESDPTQCKLLNRPIILSPEKPEPKTAGIEVEGAIVEEMDALLRYNVQHPINEVSFWSLVFPKESIKESGNSLILRSLSIYEDLGPSDPRLINLARIYSAEPSQVGVFASEIIDQSDYSSLLRKTINFTSQTDTDKSSILSELISFLRSTNKLGDAIPLVQATLSCADPEMRRDSAAAIYQNPNKSLKLIPFVAPLLNDGDSETEYQALGYLFFVSGSDQESMASRSINLPTYNTFKNDPNKYLDQAKRWYAEYNKLNP